MSEEHGRILQELRQLADTELKLARTIAPQDSLRADLQLDSLSMITLAVALEDRFRIRLEEQDAEPLETVEDLVALVAQRLSEQRP